MSDVKWRSLAQTAATLRISWAAAWRLVLLGQLVGEQRGTRWWVRADSIEKMRRQLEEARTPAATAGRG
jgi:hypothetical protein